MKKQFAQFGHFESYGRQVAAKSRASKKENGRTARDVANENDRVTGYCSHVENAKNPTILFSKNNEFKSMNDVVDRCEEVAENIKFSVDTVLNGGQKRTVEKSLRKDAKIVMMGVITMPAEMKDNWPKYRDDAVKFLKAEFGENLAFVIEHEDEANPHLHYAVVPLAGQTMAMVDPFTRAKKEAEQAYKKLYPNAEKKAVNNHGNDVYVESITAFYDRLHSEVSNKYGLTRRDMKPDGTPVRRPRKERQTYLLEKKNTLADENAVLRKKLAELEAQVGAGSVRPESKPTEPAQKPLESPKSLDDLFTHGLVENRSTSRANAFLERKNSSTPSKPTL